MKLVKDMSMAAMGIYIVLSVLFSCTSALGASRDVLLIDKNLVRIDHPIDERSIDRANEINNLTQEGAKVIDILITSPGGYVHLGEVIIAAIHQAQAKGVIVRCTVPTFAASMAANIFLNCSLRHALPTAKILFHEVAISTNAIKQRLTASVAYQLAMALHEMDKPLINHLAAVTGMTAEQAALVYIQGEGHTATAWLEMSKNPWISIVATVSGIKNLFQFTSVTADKNLKLLLDNNKLIGR